MTAPLDYDPRDVIVNFAGEDIFGFMEGTFVTVEFTTDAFSTTVGAQGSVARVGSADLRAKITWTLQQTSPSNKTLSKRAALDKKNGTGKGVLQITDKNSKDTLVHCEVAWIMKMPKTEFATSLTGREWNLETNELELVLDGSNAK